MGRSQQCIVRNVKGGARENIRETREKGVSLMVGRGTARGTESKEGIEEAKRSEQM